MKSTRLLFVMLWAWLALSVQAQEGAWKGELDFQGTKLPLVFHFADNGCTMDSPSQGAKGIPAQREILADGTVRVTIAAIGATFEGKNDGNAIRGTFTQMGMGFPLILMPGTLQVNRPQTPVPPFPYKEETVSFANDGFTFEGTLVLPVHCDRNTPVVVMVTGSGLQNRDEEMFGHKPFAVIADALARQGIASYRYDDRGYGLEGYQMYAYTTGDFASDAQVALRLMRKRFGKVGVLGHSEGGTIALMMAEQGKPDFIVTLAAMAASGKETLMRQNRASMASLGLSQGILDTCCAVVQQAFEGLAEGKKVEQLSFEGVPAELKLVLESSVKQRDTPYLRYLLNVDVSKSLDKVKCPVLALNGTKDTQVDCASNIQVLESGLINSRHEIKKFEGLNHLFQHCTTGSVLEYQQIEETIAPEVLQAIIGWLKTL